MKVDDSLFRLKGQSLDKQGFKKWLITNKMGCISAGSDSYDTNLYNISNKYKISKIDK